MTNSEQLLLLAARISGVSRANADGYTPQIGYTYAAPIGNLSATEAAIKAAAMISGDATGGEPAAKPEEKTLASTLFADTNLSYPTQTLVEITPSIAAITPEKKRGWWAGIVAWFKEKPARYGWLALLLAAVSIATIKAKKG